MRETTKATIKNVNDKPTLRRRARIFAAAGASALVAISGGFVATTCAADAPAAGAAAAPAPQAGIVVGGLDPDGRIKLVVNKTTLLTTRARVMRVSVGQQDTADVNPISGTTILVTAKKPGSTQIIIWDDQNHTQ